MAKWTLLLGSVLCFCVLYSHALPVNEDADSARVVQDVVERSLPAHVYASVVGHGRNLRRYKRDVKTKHLNDPENCIQKCHENETAMVIEATMKHLADLFKLALTDVKPADLKDKESKEALKKRTEEKIIANMGPMFDSLCSASKVADTCIQGCPSSLLREVTIVQHNEAEAFCEPRKWDNFAAYFHAMNCTNETEATGACDDKCGAQVPLSNVTHLDVEESESEDSGTDFTFETSSTKNTVAVGKACKTLTCQQDCFKPIMSDQCGAKAFDMYSRMLKLEPRATLGTLKLLKAVGKADECKSFT